MAQIKKQQTLMLMLSELFRSGSLVLSIIACLSLLGFFNSFSNRGEQMQILLNFTEPKEDISQDAIVIVFKSSSSVPLEFF